MTFFEIVGWIGFSCAIIMFLPQVIKVVKTKSVAALSTSSFLINFYGASMYVLYGAALQPKSYQAFTCNAIIMIFMLIIMFFLFRKKKSFFLIALAYATAIFTIALLFIFLLKNEMPIAAKYVFVIFGGGAIGGAFAPQLKKMLIDKKFKSYSLVMSSLMIFNSIPWIIYWVGTITNMNSYELPTGVIALIFTVTQALIQLSILGVYLSTKNDIAKHNLN